MLFSNKVNACVYLDAICRLRNALVGTICKYIDNGSGDAEYEQKRLDIDRQAN